MNQDQKQQMWDLWNLQSLFPDHGPTELEKILHEGESFDLRQNRLFANPHEALSLLESSANAFLSQNADLKNGLVISLHLGPYSLAPVPWLLAGIDVHVLVNKMSFTKIKPIYDGIQKVMPLPGEIIWVPIDGSHFALKIMRALRRKEMVFAFLDGNDGLGGSKGTLQDGMTYKLPGRNIKVRTGLSRLAARCEAPIHSVVTLWPPKGVFTWERGPTWAMNRQTDPENTTRKLFDWAFGVIKGHAPQWKCWNMLTGVYESFAQSQILPMLENLPDGTTIKWTGMGKLWPGDMLEDMAGQCFFAAEGLDERNVGRLNQEAGATVAELKREFGSQWVHNHLPRLAALGFISTG